MLSNRSQYDFRLHPKQVYKFSNLHIAFGEISMEFGPGALIRMEARPGFIGAVVIAPGRLTYRSERTGEDIEDIFEKAMLRFHPEDYERILKLEDIKAVEDM
ncbi:MAG TPA: hypothetical protein VMW72_24545 [Sedimentisphaerales bacterium]|nr:hypothetical protein [Sedimentisphaerales bacterium]